MRRRNATPARSPFVTVVLSVLILATLAAGVVGAGTVSRNNAKHGRPPRRNGYFTILPVGASLPTDADCAARVHRSRWEPRPENATPNQRRPDITVVLPDYTVNDGYDSHARSYADRVDGAFTGTTDEILQWAACKWGLDDDIARAMAVTESTWDQARLDKLGRPVKGKGFGDFTNNIAHCQSGYLPPCPQSFGIMQVKATTEIGTFPWSRDSTAFNADYALMVWRVCFNGWTTWLSQYPASSRRYVPGDAWGCVGFWYSGDWYGDNGGAERYIETVMNYDAKKAWRSW